MAKTARFGKARKPAGKLSRAVHRRQIHRRLRARVNGDGDCPRLAVFRSSRHIYAQVIDDVQGKSLAAASTTDKIIRAKASYGGNIAAAKAVGAEIGARAKKAGVKRVVFDRGGYRYHGRVKALADAAREAGLEF